MLPTLCMLNCWCRLVFALKQRTKIPSLRLGVWVWRCWCASCANGDPVSAEAAVFWPLVTARPARQKVSWTECQRPLAHQGIPPCMDRLWDIFAQIRRTCVIRSDQSRPILRWRLPQLRSGLATCFALRLHRICQQASGLHVVAPVGPLRGPSTATLASVSRMDNSQPRAMLQHPKHGSEALRLDQVKPRSCLPEFRAHV